MALPVTRINENNEKDALLVTATADSIVVLSSLYRSRSSLRRIMEIQGFQNCRLGEFASQPCDV